MSSNGQMNSLTDQMSTVSIAEATRTARFKKLHDDLHVLGGDMDNLMFMLQLSQANGRYCQTCSPSEQIGACGKTCALLAPKHRADGVVFDPPEGWVQDSVSQIDTFNKICRDLNEWGHDVTDMQLRIWECTVHDMLSVCMSNQEANPEDEPREIEVEFKEVNW
jgi:hypothetical protein